MNASVARVPFGDLDLEADFRRIGHPGAAVPSHECLDRLIAAHAAAMGFENFEVLARRAPRLDLSRLQDKLVRQRRGGFSFEQNTLFRTALQARAAFADALPDGFGLDVTPAHLDAVTARSRR